MSSKRRVDHKVLTNEKRRKRQLEAQCRYHEKRQYIYRGLI